MPIAKCEKCGEEVRWHNYRGVRLKDIPCPKCGGRLRPWGYFKTNQEECSRATLEILKTSGSLEVREICARVCKLPKFEGKISDSTVCGHLRRLMEAGLVEAEQPTEHLSFVFWTLCYRATGKHTLATEGYQYSKTPRPRLKREEWDQAILRLLKTPLEERELIERLNNIPKFEKRLDAYRHLRRLVWDGKVEEIPSKEPYALASQNMYKTREEVGRGG